MKRCRFGLLILSLILLTGCATNPATGRRQFNLMSISQQTALGEQAQPELIAEYGGEVQSPELREFFKRVGTRVARQVEEPYRDLPWEFTLLDSEVINAFALPGGKVFMTRGLLAYMDNEAQVAGVLGHEVGHVTAEHAGEQLSYAMGAQVFANVLLAASEGGDYSQLTELLVGVGGQGFLMKFSRDHEYESDIQGLKYMTRAGYDPHAMADVLNILLELGGTSGSLMEFFSTHPDTDKRLARVEQMLGTEYRHTANNPAFKTYSSRFRRDIKPLLAPSK
ncbi:MAG: M48 family metalloprotease [Phycisphaerales bacterium]|nr:MAG: M48 family metalloprotease [Phycisphaerales bacterium]